MNLKYEETNIDGTMFATTQFAAVKGFTLLQRLMKVIGPAMAALSRASGEAELMTALPAALSDVKPEESTALALELLSNTTATFNGQLLTLNTQTAVDMVFSGRLPAMFKVLAFVVKVNFADFFDAGAAGALSETTTAKA